MDERSELVAFLVVALLGGALFAGFAAGSPTGGTPIEHDKAAAAGIAADFIAERGADPGAYRTSTTYTVRSQASVYLQRTLPAAEAAAAVREYDVEHWEARFYRPLEREEFRVAVDPTSGAVIGFTHVLPEEAPGANLTRAAARERAAAFLRSQGHDVEGYELVSSSTTERPARTDHTFVWEVPSRSVADAPYEVRVEVKGGQVGEYDPHIDVPESFLHGYRTRQQRGLVLSVGFLALSAALVIAAVVYGLRYYKRGAFDARYGLALGGTVAGLSLLSTVNALPGVLHAVPTTIRPAFFLAGALVGAALSALLLGGITLVAAGAGKELAAEVLGAAPVDRLRAVLDDPATRRRVAHSTTRGFLLALALLGVYAAFYLVGTRLFDVWLPAGTPFASAVSMYVPALAALTVGGVAAVWEEAVYRLFAIPLAERYLKYTPLAVLVPAFVWGLGHSNYAVLPFYARAVEVTLIGVVLGWAFLRYDLLTTVSAHFSLNALAVGVPMLLAGTGGLLVHGVGAVAIALAPLYAAGGLVAYGRR